jgi:hypothetical protein
MRIVTSLFIALALCQCYCQQRTITVLDEVSREPVPYATVRYGATGSYTAGDGTVKLADSVTAVEVSHLSYKTKHFDKLTDILLLTPNVTQLKEVVLQQKRQRKTVRISNGTGNTHRFWPYFPKTEHLVFVAPEPKIAGTQVDEVRFFGELAGDCQPDSLVFTFSIYNKNKELLCEDIAVIKAQALKKEGITARPSQNIFLENEGLYFGIELMGWYSEGKFLENMFGNHPFCVRTRYVKGNEWNTYYHNIFHDNDQWQHLNGNNKKLEYFDDKPKNMQIELKLLK